MSFHNALHQLHHAIRACTKAGIDPYTSSVPTLIHDFRSQHAHAARTNFHAALKTIQHEIDSVRADKTTTHLLRQLCEKLSTANTITTCSEILEQLTTITADIHQTKTEAPSLHPAILPADIKDEVLADLAEVHACYQSGCYRSVVILCGRLLETALHRKYYEATQNDLLEKAPGIGLGNLIAKMAEKNIALDPGLSNQIHLINQIRVFSVHKKNTPFHPSKEQAHAILLYTIDVFNKLFGNPKL